MDGVDKSAKSSATRTSSTNLTSLGLTNELADVQQRTLLLDDYAHNISSNNNNDYLKKKIELLLKENSILRSVNAELSSSDTNKSAVKRVLTNLKFNPQDHLLFRKINISSIYAIRFKPNRTIYFGPTCFRSSIAYNENYAKIYYSISKITNKSRKLFKNSRRNLEFASYFPFNIDGNYEAQYENPNTPSIIPLQINDPPSNIHNVEALVLRLVNFLPNYSSLTNHINEFFDRFLDKLYPFAVRSYIFEIFNEVFKPKLASDSNDSYSNKNDYNILLVNRYRDCSRIALILSLVKISIMYTDHPFNSINPELPNNETSKIECLLLYFSMKFLSLSKLLKRPLISSLQALLFLKVSGMYHLNEGEGGDSSDGQPITSLSFNLAVMCGLHRDIDKVYKDATSEHKTMLKYIWKYLMYLDWQQSFDLGYPLQSDDLRFSETSLKIVMSSYKEEVDESFLNYQFKILNEKANEDGEVDILFYDYFMPIARGLVYQLNTLQRENMTIFKLELYLQNFIKFYNNANFFSPLFESLANPLVQDNQLPKNGYKFIKFIRKIAFQIILIDIIFTLYNLILMIIQKQEAERPAPSLNDHVYTNLKLINFYGNQAVNFVIFIIRSTKKFLEIKTKDRVFQIYTFANIRKIVHRSSNFIYSNLLFSYTSSKELSLYSLKKKNKKNFTSTDINSREGTAANSNTQNNSDNDNISLNNNIKTEDDESDEEHYNKIKTSGVSNSITRQVEDNTNNLSALQANTRAASFQYKDFHNNYECYFNTNRPQVRNILLNSKHADSFSNSTSIDSFSDEDFDAICFGRSNQYKLVEDGDLQRQYEIFREFITKKYTYYNFYNRKLELSNLIFEFYFKNVHKNVKDYYVFYVGLRISMLFYAYFKDRNLVKNEIAFVNDNNANNNGNGAEQKLNAPNDTSNSTDINQGPSNQPRKDLLCYPYPNIQYQNQPLSINHVNAGGFSSGPNGSWSEDNNSNRNSNGHLTSSNEPLSSYNIPGGPITQSQNQVPPTPPPHPQGYVGPHSQVALTAGAYIPGPGSNQVHDAPFPPFQANSYSSLVRPPPPPPPLLQQQQHGDFALIDTNANNSHTSSNTHSNNSPASSNLNQQQPPQPVFGQGPPLYNNFAQPEPNMNNTPLQQGNAIEVGATSGVNDNIGAGVNVRNSGPVTHVPNQFMDIPPMLINNSPGSGSGQGQGQGQTPGFPSAAATDLTQVNLFEEYNPLDMMTDDFYIDMDDFLHQISTQY